MACQMRMSSLQAANTAQVPLAQFSTVTDGFLHVVGQAPGLSLQAIRTSFPEAPSVILHTYA